MFFSPSNSNNYLVNYLYFSELSCFVIEASCLLYVMITEYPHMNFKKNSLCYTEDDLQSTDFSQKQEDYMKETVVDIKNRRSVKRLTNDFNLGRMNAPSGGNRQPAVFIVVQNREWIDKLCVLNAKIAGAPEGWDVFYGAPTLIVVAASTSSPDAVKDGSLASGNMLDAAYALGLGGRWINRADGMLEDELGKELLKEAGYEGDYIGVGNVILGYPAGDFPAPLSHKEDYYRIIR